METVKEMKQHILQKAIQKAWNTDDPFFYLKIQFIRYQFKYWLVTATADGKLRIYNA